jgi:hypothetical protein
MRLFTDFLTTPWNRVIHEKLTGYQLVKKFPMFYGTQQFINTFTSSRHLSLSWAKEPGLYGLLTFQVPINDA